MEVWQDIKGYENYYQASDLGRIRSLSRYVNTQHAKDRFVNGRILIPRQKKGYLRVNLSVKGVHTTVCVHQLVADAFLDNRNNYESINHIDGNKLNNALVNLERCSIAQNNLHAYRVLGKVNPMQGRRGVLNPNSKPIICITTGERYDNIREAGEKLNLISTSIVRVCKGKRGSISGLKFKYA